MWENMPFKSYIVNSYSIIQMKHSLKKSNNNYNTIIKTEYTSEQIKKFILSSIFYKLLFLFLLIVYIFIFAL